MPALLVTFRAPLWGWLSYDTEISLGYLFMGEDIPWVQSMYVEFVHNPGDRAWC